MIRLDIGALVFFYILFSVIFILIAWLAFGYKGIKRYRMRESEYIWRCSVCFQDYIDSRHEDISVCPMCGSYNKKEEVKI